VLGHDDPHCSNWRVLDPIRLAAHHIHLTLCLTNPLSSFRPLFVISLYVSFPIHTCRLGSSAFRISSFRLTSSLGIIYMDLHRTTLNGPPLPTPLRSSYHSPPPTTRIHLLAAPPHRLLPPHTHTRSMNTLVSSLPFGVVEMLSCRASCGFVVWSER